MYEKIRTQSKPLFSLILEPKPISWSNEKAKHSLGRQKIQWWDLGQLESITKIIEFIHKSHYNPQVCPVACNGEPASSSVIHVGLKEDR